MSTDDTATETPNVRHLAAVPPPPAGAPEPSMAEELAAYIAANPGIDEEDASEAVVAARRLRKAQRDSRDPAVLIPKINEALGFTPDLDPTKPLVVGVTHTVTDDPDFTLWVRKPDGTDAPVVLGSALRWTQRPAEFAARFLTIGEYPVPPKGQARIDLYLAITRAATPVDIGFEATEVGETASWIREYLDQRPPIDLTDEEERRTIAEARIARYPFRRTIDGTIQVGIFGEAFRQWLVVTYGEKVTSKAMGTRFRDVGCESTRVRIDNSTTTAWLVDRASLPDASPTPRG